MDRTQVRRSWDRVAETYAARRRADGEDAELLSELLKSLPADGRVLDLGCGDGMRTLRPLAVGARTVGVDLSARQCALARENVPSADVVQGEMTRLPFDDDRFDAVTAYHAVFHVPRREHPLVYREVARVLRPGGQFLCTVGRGRTETTVDDWLGTGERMYWSTPGPATTRTQLDEAGFEVDWERLVDDPLGSSALFVLATLGGRTGEALDSQSR